MGNIFCIFSKVQLKEDSILEALERREDYLDNQITNKIEKTDFKAIAAKNKEAEEKAKQKRAKDNINVLKSYRIK